MTGSAIIGTPAYMSPEQAQSEKIDGRSDIYGMGVIIYEMLTGRQPYEADTPMGVVIKHITDPVPDISDTNPKLSPDVSNVIKTAMAKDRNERYRTMTELSNAVNTVAGGNGSTSMVSGTVAQRVMPTSSSGRKVLMIAVSLLILAGLAGVFYFVSSRPSSLPQATEVPTQTEQPTQPPTEALSPTVEAPAGRQRLLRGGRWAA